LDFVGDNPVEPVPETFFGPYKQKKIRYRPAKRHAPADDGSMGAYRWFSHLANACEVSPVTALLSFELLPVAIQDTLTTRFDFPYGMFY